jgi:voltage-gated potassium channel
MTRLSSWERGVEWPLVTAAVIFLEAYATPILDRGASQGVRTTCEIVLYVTWSAFIVDYLTRLCLAERRARYFLRHLPDLIMLAVPMLRPLRLLRLLVLLKMLNRRGAKSLRGRVAVYVGSAATTVIFCAALAVLDAERTRAGANITTFGDALWWAVSTVTTVGYGDLYPVSAEGRLIAVGLMLTGIALIGVVTATVASWLIDRVREVETESRAATAADVHALRLEMVALREQLRPPG